MGALTRRHFETPKRQQHELALRRLHEHPQRHQHELQPRAPTPRAPPWQQHEPPPLATAEVALGRRVLQC